MYWPLGTPRIFALNSGRTPAAQYSVSRDGLPPPENVTEQTNDRPALLSPTSASGPELGHPSTPITPVTPVTPLTPAIKSVEYGDHGEGILDHPPAPLPPGVPPREPLLALQVARAGHIFGVLTATTITIWQTKVRYIA